MKAYNFVAVAVLATAAVSTCAHAQTQSVAAFYKGKTLQVVVPAGAGGDYDLRTRLLARHIGRFIPGNPTSTVVNMPGAIGVVAANWLHLKARRDGTALHMLFQNMPVLQAIKKKGVLFDVRKFNWLGNTTNSPNVINSWHTSGITRIEDVYTRQLIVGAPGTASTSYVYPAVLNEVAGTKFKIVTGYLGGNATNIAMEKGEVGGRGSNSWASWKSGHPQWIKDKTIHILVQVGLKRAPDLPDVPLMLELARNEADKKYLAFLSSDMGISRPLVTTQDVPADRLAALRKAFKDMMFDKQFLADAARSKTDIEYSNGEEALAIANMMMSADADVLKRASKLLGGSIK